jgi:hypothetical protein
MSWEDRFERTAKDVIKRSIHWQYEVPEFLLEYFDTPKDMQHFAHLYRKGDTRRLEQLIRRR